MPCSSSFLNHPTSTVLTVMVLLCVNTVATVSDSLCLLGCSPDFAVDVVWDDVRKPFGQSLIHD
jgi:hypothetical protein